eukprot:CAMPEP_0174976632 /NCGR_PEP_ID=MMETSP0004_2-20121128/13136_1 /TAXON_ID=420556 /ORGANISM="Ochromonas sp., Strain CCMP1393" /LENGTH=71 /DNA_ID=CAMNT_0016227675 /DNA_START=241 /DNA_END=456 /DNA_ORIENTATION=-
MSDPMFAVKIPDGMDPFLSKKEKKKLEVRLEAQAVAAAAGNGTETKSDLELLREEMRRMIENMSPDSTTDS